MWSFIGMEEVLTEEAISTPMEPTARSTVEPIQMKTIKDLSIEPEPLILESAAPKPPVLESAASRPKEVV